MNEAEMRGDAWDGALHAHGTFTIFSRRLRRVQWRTRVRDFFGIAVPVLIGFVATTSFPALLPYRDVALFAVGSSGLLQLIITIWALIAGWDEELAYNRRSLRDNYELQQQWEKIGKGQPVDLEFAYRVASEQKRVTEAQDVERDITEAEKQLGMRAGLFNYQRQCASCHKVPSNPYVPRLLRKRCGVCGGSGK